jgi:hypothetical protein|uniref:Poly(A) polymerase catalytic subunit domain-containing protein n=1 Tax=viral metagenome TaxID=1070528 RepID=A0A6C0ILY2_9ZZZZ
MKKQNNKFNNKNCNNDMSFEECELALLRNAVDETENIQGKELVSNEEVMKMLDIVEQFIINKKLICYGGTAINNILPVYDQFYKKDVEIPDYDFFSSNALEDAKELANIYYESGYNDVEAKAGVHMGTFKVYVNYIPVADITFMHVGLFDKMLKDSIKIAGIHYCPPDYLRMAMYLELSRPKGDVSRWEKVLKRLNLLNKHFPMKVDSRCKSLKSDKKLDTQHYPIIRNTLINNQAVFFGGFAATVYSKFDQPSKKNTAMTGPNFDVLYENPTKLALIIEEELERHQITNVKKIEYNAIGELIPSHIELQINGESCLFIYKPIACHNYNKVTYLNQQINIATIDTILSFYLAFYYSDLLQYDNNKLLCTATFLAKILEKNKLDNSGIMKRYSLDCIGSQPTLKSMRAEKANKFRELKNNRLSSEYEMWFLNYSPFKQDDKIINSKEKILKSQESTPSKSKTKKKLTKQNKSRTSRTTNKKTTNILDRLFKKK